MNNERILAHQASKKLTAEDLRDATSGGSMNVTGGNGSYGPCGFDGTQDVTFDF